jgi:DNA-binding beta-propeller fold protein YncE
MRAGIRPVIGVILAVAAASFGVAGPASAAPEVKLPPGGATFKIGGNPGPVLGTYAGDEFFLAANGSDLDLGHFEPLNTGVDVSSAGFTVNSMTYDAIRKNIWVAGSNGTLLWFNGGEKFTIPVGSGPIVADSHSDLVWLTYPASGAVAGFDESKQQILTTIQVGPDLGAIAADPPARTLWVAGDHGFVFVISEVSKSVTAKIPVARSPKPGIITGIATDQDTKTVWVTSYIPGAHAAELPGKLTEISAVTDKVLATIPVGPKPSALAAEPQTGTLWVTVPGQDKLQLIDENPPRIVDTFATGADPVSVSAEPIGQDVWVSDHQDGTVRGYYIVPATIRSRPQVSAEAGHAFHFDVRAQGSPLPTVTITGKLPPGVRKIVKSTGEIELTGTPAQSAANQSFRLTVSAGNGIGNASHQYTVVQQLVITVSAGSPS